jgi:hypothetical protein
MSTVGAFAAYGPFGGFGFPTQTPKNRAASPGSADNRPGAGPQRSNEARISIGGVPEPASVTENETNRPIEAPEAAEKDRLETALTGQDSKANTKANATSAAPEEESAFNPTETVEKLSERIEEQVQRFEDFLKRLNDYNKLRDAKQEKVDESKFDLFGRVQDARFEAGLRANERAAFQSADVDRTTTNPPATSDAVDGQPLLDVVL